MIHFIYKTTSASGKYYIGRHSTSKLDDGYLGSGKWIRSMENKSGLTREILAYACSFDELLLLEEKFIADHLSDPNNMNFNNRPVGFATGKLNWAQTAEGKAAKSARKKGVTLEMEYGKERAAEIKKKISLSRTGRKTNKPSWNRGVTTPYDVRQKIAKSVAKTNGMLTADERREKFGNVGEANGFYNKSHSPQTLTHLREKQQANRKNNRVICEHCNKDLDKANYSRHHGDKCKLK